MPNPAHPVDMQLVRAIATVQRRLEDYMKRRGMVSRGELAKDLGVPLATLTNILHPRRPVVPSPETLAVIRKKVSFTSTEVRKIEIAYSRRMSLSRSRGGKKRFAQAAAERTAEPTAETLSTIATLERRIAVLERRVFGEEPAPGEREPAQPAAAGEPPGGPLERSYAALLNGRGLEQYRVQYKLKTFPYVLTKDNFRVVDAARWSKREREHFVHYCNYVLETARKLLVILAQLQPAGLREELLKQLGMNLDLLWKTYKEASSVAPMEFIGMIDLERGALTPGRS